MSLSRDEQLAMKTDTEHSSQRLNENSLGSLLVLWQLEVSVLARTNYLEESVWDREELLFDKSGSDIQLMNWMVL